MHRVHWPAKVIGVARLYFDEDERLVVATDKVNLADAVALQFEITVENLVTLLPQEFRR